MYWGKEMKLPRSPACAALRGRARQGAIAVSRVAFVISAFAALSGCEQNSFVPPPPPKVDVGLPVQQAVTRYLDATGNTAPIQSGDLVARVQGVLQSINYKDGSFVKQGTTLFTIEPETYKLKLEQAQAAEAGSQASLKQAEAALSGLSNPAGRVLAALRWLAAGTGPLATGGYDLVCQFKSAPDQPRPDVQGLFAPMALDTSSADLKLAGHPGILFMAYPIRPQTSSTVHISGQDPADPPVIAPRFLDSAADRAAVAPVLAMAREVLASSPVADLIAAEEFPGPAVTTAEQTVRYSLASGTGIYHAVGAAAMGVNADDVTDPQLRVRGAEGLRVADASVLPVQVSGNTGAPAMLVGYRAADLILDEL